MKSAIKTIVGLVFDDWWLFFGVIVSIVLSYAALKVGIGAQTSGWIWLVLIVITLTLSLTMEFRRKTRQS